MSSSSFNVVRPLYPSQSPAASSLRTAALANSTLPSPSTSQTSQSGNPTSPPLPFPLRAASSGLSAATASTSATPTTISSNSPPPASGLSTDPPSSPFGSAGLQLTRHFHV